MIVQVSIPFEPGDRVRFINGNNGIREGIVCRAEYDGEVIRVLIRHPDRTEPTWSIPVTRVAKI